MQEILEQASDTDACLICCDAGHHAAEMFRELYPGQAAVVVSDQATYEIQGRLIDENLRQAGIRVYPPKSQACNSGTEQRRLYKP